MQTELKMPALSPTMEKGTLARWLVGVGDLVRAGDLIAEVETDKATMEIEATDDGQIAALVIADGAEDIPVGAVIALLAESRETTETHEEPAAPVTHSPIAQPSSGAIVDEQSIDVTPLARRIAEGLGLSLDDVIGSGPGGRIIKADLVKPVRPVASGLPAVIAPEGARGAASNIPHDAIKLTSMRKAISRRLTEAKQTIPHFYLTARCNIDALLKMRADLNAHLAPQGVKLSVNDIIIKAMALAMVRVPDCNVQFTGDELYRFSRVDISMAVAIPGGLVTPVLTDVGSMSLSAIARSSRALAARAREGKLTPHDYEGGAASISNLGMFGIDAIIPVINPPQAFILGIGAGIEQPWKVEQRVSLATIMAATGSFDHRAIDGATAAQFMAALREFVESPPQMLA